MYKPSIELIAKIDSVISIILSFNININSQQTLSWLLEWSVISWFLYTLIIFSQT